MPGDTMNPIAQVSVPPAIREHAERELFPGEKVLWAGKPCGTPPHILDFFTQVAWCVALPVWSFCPEAPVWAALPLRLLIFIPALTVALYPLWVRYGRARMVCVVTDHRVFRVYPGLPFGAPHVEAYGMMRMGHTYAEMQDWETDRGDVVLGYRCVINGHPYARYPWGFINVEHPQEITELILREHRRTVQEGTCRRPAPAAEDYGDLTDEQQTALQEALEPCEFVCHAERALQGFDYRTLFISIGYTLLTAAFAATLYATHCRCAPGVFKVFWETAAALACLMAGCTAYGSWQRWRCSPLLCYAITTHRVLALHPQAGVLDEFPMRPTMLQTHRIRKDGSGELILGYTNPDTPYLRHSIPEGLTRLRSVAAFEEHLRRQS